MTYYSQSLQDKFIDKIVFNCKENGFFIEIGAYDGLSFSNSYFLEKNRKWKGICVEPIPDVFERLVKNRNCMCVNACVAEFDGEVELLHVNGPSEMLTGIANNYNSQHCDRIDREVSERGGEKNYLKIPAINLNNLLSKHSIENIDYCSIDVEGSELSILSSLDFDKIRIKTFTIENNFKDNQIRNLLKSKGYSYIGELEADQVFIKNEINQNFWKEKIFCMIYNITTKIRHKINK